jgi:putative copper export protein
MPWPLPTQRTTPGQFLVLLIAGAFLLYLSTGQPLEKAELAARAWSLGVKAIIGAAVLGLATWLGYRFLTK